MQWHWNWGLWALAAVLVFWSIGASAAGAPARAPAQRAGQPGRAGRGAGNQAVEAYNAAIRQFPTRVLMSFVGFSEARSL